MWYLAWRNTVRRRSQSMLTVIITALTIFIFVIVFSVFLMMQEGLSLSGKRLGADVIVLPDLAKADAYQTLFTANPANVYMPKSIIEKLSNIEGVEQASPQFFTQTLTGGCCSYGEEIRLVGYDEKTDFILKPYFNEQNFDRLEDDQVIIGSKVEAHLGNVVAILGKPFTVVGTLYPTGSGMDGTIYLNIDVARKLARDIPELQHLWKDALPDDLISSILIKTQNSTSKTEVVDEIKQSGLGVQAVATSETINNARSQIDIISKVIFGLCLSSLMITVLSLIGRFNSLAKERKREIGLLRAIGIQKKQIFQLIMSEAWLMAFIGGVLGSLLACICVIPILGILESAFVLPSGIWTWSTALKSGCFGVLVAILLGFVASVYPAWKSASLDPQEAITQGALE
ncbi:MAG: Macrolide export ATP-binding/permease protein MacB [Pelotomaculum sp. PtaB.Bin013]|nr:MAG: Macrolide export ATP-binding/permease protein MacB [Pelotomaculum sp. PtaB.Bin013]